MSPSVLVIPFLTIVSTSSWLNCSASLNSISRSPEAARVLLRDGGACEGQAGAKACKSREGSGVQDGAERRSGNPVMFCAPPTPLQLLLPQPSPVLCPWRVPMSAASVNGWRAAARPDRACPQAHLQRPRDVSEEPTSPRPGNLPSRPTCLLYDLESWPWRGQAPAAHRRAIAAAPRWPSARRVNC